MTLYTSFPMLLHTMTPSGQRDLTAIDKACFQGRAVSRGQIFDLGSGRRHGKAAVGLWLLLTHRGVKVLGLGHNLSSHLSLILRLPVSIYLVFKSRMKFAKPRPKYVAGLVRQRCHLPSGVV